MSVAVDEAAIHKTMLEDYIKVTFLQNTTTTDSPVIGLPLMAMSS